MEYKLISWNVNGIRATKDGVESLLQDFKPTVLSIQETKAEKSQLDSEFRMQPGYKSYWVSSVAKKGYSGVANFVIDSLEPMNIGRSSKTPPNNAGGLAGFGLDTEEMYEFDKEGRILSMEFDEFILFNVYFPNGGAGNKRVPFKMEFYDKFLTICQELMAQGKQIVVCGDVNTAHHPIDLKNAKANVKNTGFLPEERAWMDKFLGSGFIDTFRHLNPDKEGAYTYWSARAVTARERNTGWRIDYYFITKGLLSNLKAANVHQEIMGSDHCPVSIILEF